jgi:hypothetical protein
MHGMNLEQGLIRSIIMSENKKWSADNANRLSNIIYEWARNNAFLIDRPIPYNDVEANDPDIMDGIQFVIGSDIGLKGRLSCGGHTDLDFGEDSLLPTKISTGFECAILTLSNQDSETDGIREITINLDNYEIGHQFSQSIDTEMFHLAEAVVEWSIWFFNQYNNTSGIEGPYC